MAPPTIISGDVHQFDPRALGDALKAVGIKRIDTAASYQQGESEKIIGRSGLSKGFTIDTKVLWYPPGEGIYHRRGRREKRLDKVNVLHCHGPDFTTPIEEQARALDAQYKKGRLTHLGVSNFSPQILGRWLNIAETEGLVKPSVYQGQYNIICRGFETEIFPLLRAHNIAFNAYSPMAGGFLLGNFTAEGVQGGTRFHLRTPFNVWSDKPELHEAIKRYGALSERVGIGMDELSLRWIVHHSALGEGDGVIMGYGKIESLAKNMEMIRKGPLDDAVVRELEAWSGSAREASLSIVTFSYSVEGIKQVFGG